MTGPYTGGRNGQQEQTAGTVNNDRQKCTSAVLLFCRPVFYDKDNQIKRGE